MEGDSRPEPQSLQWGLAHACFAVKQGRHMTPVAKERNMLGADGQTVGDFILILFPEFLQSGTAPKGP